MKKIFIMLLCVKIFLTGIGNSAYAVKYDDIMPGSPFVDDIDFVTEFGFMTKLDDGTFGDMKIVTRAEFIETVAPLSGMYEDLAVKDWNNYIDVPEDSSYASSVAVARYLNLISDNAEHKFYPDRPISRNEAIKILVCLLGYGIKAQKAGDYPL